MDQDTLEKTDEVIQNANEARPNMTEMTKCMDKATFEGYTAQFKATEEGLELLSSGKIYAPSDIKVANYFRDEGISDPDDMMIIYLIETNDGMKGTLTDAYGTYSDPDVARIITEVENIHKKVNKR